MINRYFLFCMSCRISNSRGAILQDLATQVTWIFWWFCSEFTDTFTSVELIAGLIVKIDGTFTCPHLWSKRPCLNLIVCICVKQRNHWEMSVFLSGFHVHVSSTFYGSQVYENPLESFLTHNEEWKCSILILSCLICH